MQQFVWFSLRISTVDYYHIQKYILFNFVCDQYRFNLDCSFFSLLLVTEYIFVIFINYQPLSFITVTLI